MNCRGLRIFGLQVGGLTGLRVKGFWGLGFAKAGGAQVKSSPSLQFQYTSENISSNAHGGLLEPDLGSLAGSLLDLVWHDTNDEGAKQIQSIKTPSNQQMYQPQMSLMNC